MAEWRPITGYVGIYEVSDTGVVRSLARTCNGRGGSQKPIPGVELKPQLCRDGYYRVKLCNSGSEFRLIHRLVAAEFVEDYFDGAQVNHVNGDKLDNRAANLEWVTAKENTVHAIKDLGRRRDGVHSGMSKLSSEVVAEIRRVYAAEMSVPTIYGKQRKRPRDGVMAPYIKKYGQSLISRLTRGDTYKEIVN